MKPVITSWICVARNVRRRLLKAVVPEWVWPREVVLDGAAIPVRSQPFSFGVKRALCRGTYELPERTLITSVMTPGIQVIELGGSLGVVTAVTAEAAGPNGRVATVEASPELAAIAKGWLGPRYPNVTILAGFGFPTMTLPYGLRVGGFRTDGASLGGRVDFALSLGGHVSEESPASHVYDLATMMRAADVPRPELLVCDIEGSELVMADESFSVPDTLTAIVIELHPHLYPRREIDEQRITTSLKQVGFSQENAIGASRLFRR